jgi:hypothetical protein
VDIQRRNEWKRKRKGKRSRKKEPTKNLKYSLSKGISMGGDSAGEIS